MHGDSVISGGQTEFQELDPFQHGRIAGRFGRGFIQQTAQSGGGFRSVEIQVWFLRRSGLISDLFQLEEIGFDIFGGRTETAAAVVVQNGIEIQPVG